MNIIIKFHIFELAAVPNISSNIQFWFFGRTLRKKRYFQSNTKSVNITNEFSTFELVWISNSTLNKKFAQKEYFLPKLKRISSLNAAHSN